MPSDAPVPASLSPADIDHCEQCGRWFARPEPGAPQVSCCVIHHGECCHYGRTEVAPPTLATPPTPERLEALERVAAAARRTREAVQFIPGDPDEFYMHDAELGNALAALTPLSAPTEGER